MAVLQRCTVFILCFILDIDIAAPSHHGLPGDQAEEGGQEERQARGDIHGNLQLLQLQMAHKPI